MLSILKKISVTVAPVLAILLLETSCGKKSESDDAPAPQTLTVDVTEAQALSTKYCAGCHSGEKARKGVKLDSAETMKQNATKSALEIEANKMPPEKAKAQPSADEKAKLLAWFKANK